MKKKKSAFWGSFPCVKCGYCCKKATCDIGLTHGANQTNCDFLIGTKPGEYSCLLVNKKIYPQIKMHLAIGDGCCEPLNTDRKLALGML
jgi:hypothetical protein